MKKDNWQTGRRGEDLAIEYLQKKGYRIEERNFRTRFGEVDIVCWEGKRLVFVEVKTKKGHDFGEPEEMINKGKLARIKRMGEVYLQDKKREVACRIDVVAVVLGEDSVVERLDHYEGVY